VVLGFPTTRKPVHNGEAAFRIKGYRQMPQLVDALHRHARPETATNTDTDTDTRTVGAAA
jgi:putative transposase